MHISETQALNRSRLQKTPHVHVLGTIEWKEIQMPNRPRGILAPGSGRQLVRVRRKTRASSCRFLLNKRRYGFRHRWCEHVAMYVRPRRPRVPVGPAGRWLLRSLDRARAGSCGQGEHTGWPNHQDAQAAKGRHSPTKTQDTQPNDKCDEQASSPKFLACPSRRTASPGCAECCTVTAASTKTLVPITRSSTRR